jgi:acetoin utilization deacetylase AcuC-like enzyme
VCLHAPQVHQGDGTATIFADEPSVFTFSMHCGKNFPFRKSASDLDVDLPPGTDDAAYLSALRAALPEVLRRSEAELVLYDAGVDVYRDDKLGWLQLSHAGIWQRDVTVVDACAAAGVPVATVIGGGYDDDPIALARRHALVVRAAALVCRRRGMGMLTSDRGHVL